MAVGPETVLVRAIRREVLRHWPDAYVLKVHGGGYQEAGTPDLLLCVRGRFFGLEVKAPRPGESEEHARDRATPVQRERLRQISAAGGTAAVVLAVDEAVETIRLGLHNS